MKPVKETQQQPWGSEQKVVVLFGLPQTAVLQQEL
jgi:hypothetical protein